MSEWYSFYTKWLLLPQQLKCENYSPIIPRGLSWHDDQMTWRPFYNELIHFSHYKVIMRQRQKAIAVKRPCLMRALLSSYSLCIICEQEASWVFVWNVKSRRCGGNSTRRGGELENACLRPWNRKNRAAAIAFRLIVELCIIDIMPLKYAITRGEHRRARLDRASIMPGVNLTNCSNYNIAVPDEQRK